MASGFRCSRDSAAVGADGTARFLFTVRYSRPISTCAVRSRGAVDGTGADPERRFTCSRMRLNDMSRGRPRA